MKTLFFRSLLIIVALTTVNVIAQTNDNHLKERIDSYLSNNVSNGLSGSILIAKEGKILLSKGYGFADRENKIKNTSKTIFDIASNTKQFTATAILKLVEQERISLADNLEMFFKNAPENKKNITIHQLLTHSSGLKSDIGRDDFEKTAFEDFLNGVFASKLLSAPGTKYNYSNIGYSLLTIILEKVSGQEYEDLYKWYKALKTNLILPESLQKKLFTKHIKRNESEDFYGYGWETIETSRKTKVVYHLGLSQFFHSVIMWFTDEDVFVVYSTNSMDEQVEDNVPFILQRMVFDQNYKPKHIIKSQYSYVLEFVKANTLSTISELTASFKKKYGFELNDKRILNSLGYFLINQKEKNEWAIPLLKLNIDLFPGDGNLWDTLGEAYLITGQKPQAIDSFEKALELKPESNCYWCDNATDKLKKLKIKE